MVASGHEIMINGASFIGTGEYLNTAKGPNL
jgi:hypothetical protein